MMRYCLFLWILSFILFDPSVSGKSSGEKFKESKTDFAKEISDEIIMFDSFFNDEAESDRKKRLGYFANEIKRRSGEIGYVVSYAETSEKSKSNLEKIKMFLSKKKKVDLQRLVFINAGNSNKGRTDLYIQPKDALSPVSGNF